MTDGMRQKSSTPPLLPNHGKPNSGAQNSTGVAGSRRKCTYKAGLEAEPELQPRHCNKGCWHHKQPLTAAKGSSFCTAAFIIHSVFWDSLCVKRSSGCWGYCTECDRPSVHAQVVHTVVLWTSWLSFGNCCFCFYNSAFNMLDIALNKEANNQLDWKDFQELHKSNKGSKQISK